MATALEHEIARAQHAATECDMRKHQAEPGAHIHASSPFTLLTNCSIVALYITVLVLFFCVSSVNVSIPGCHVPSESLPQRKGHSMGRQ
jgi:hypothetical protein